MPIYALATPDIQSGLAARAYVQVIVAARHIARLVLNDDGNAYPSEPSGIVAFIFEAEADEHPPPPVPARVALLGSILSTEATALSIREGILEKDRIARFTVEDSIRGIRTTSDS